MSPAGPIKRAAAIVLIALFVLSSVPYAYAHRHHRHESSRSLIDFGKIRLDTACDLDADLRPDRLTLIANGDQRTLNIRFGDARRSQVSFRSRTNAPGNLFARDIDRDGDVDLVWVGTGDRQNAVVLVNNGEGNFAEATDNSPYASELDGLFGGIDPSGNLKLKRGRKTSTLASASFHQVGLPLLTRFQCIATSRFHVSIEPPLSQSSFTCCIRKRGPPVVLS